MAPNETSSSIEFLTVDDNWVWDTHGQVTVQIKNTNVTPALPEYEPEPTAPVAPTATVHNVTVADMPTADKPTQQKVAVHYYNIKKTPKVEKTSTPAPATPETPKAVETAIILPHTNANEKQGFQFKAGVPNFQTTLSVPMQLQAKIRQAQSQTYGDVPFFNKELASKVQDLVSKSIELTFAYRDLDLLIKGTDRNTESGLNKIEEQLYQAKKQLKEVS